MNTDSIKNYINQQITIKTHQPSSINGPLRWQLFPSAGIKIKDIHIGNAKDNSGTHANIKQIVLKVELLPLLRKQLVFHKIKIDGLDAVLHEKDLQPSLLSKQKTRQKGDPSGQKATAVPRLRIHTFDITNSQIILNLSKQQVKINQLQCKANHFNLDNKPFSIQLHAEFTAQNEKLHGLGQLKFNGNASINPTASTPLQAKGQIHIHALQLNQLYLDDIKGNFSIKNNRIDINPLTSALYQGHSTGLLSLSPQQELRIEQRATGLNGKKLLHDLTGKNLIAGTLGFSIRSTLPLQPSNPFDALNGTGELNVTSGTLYDVDINAVINTLEQQISHVWRDKVLTLRDALGLSKVDPDVATSGNTPFDRASLTFSIAQHEFDGQNILIQTPQLNISGQFNLNLLNEQLQGRLETNLTGLPHNSHLTRIQRKLGGNFPFTLSGSLSQPILLPDRKMIAPIIKNYILRDSLQDKLKKPVKKIGHELKKLFH